MNKNILIILSILLMTGCSSFVKKNKEDTKEFYSLFFQEIRQDAANGGGHYLTTFLNMNGCNMSVHHSIGSHLKENYTYSFQTNASTSYERLVDILGTQQAFVQNCSKIKSVDPLKLKISEVDGIFKNSHEVIAESNERLFN